MLIQSNWKIPANSLPFNFKIDNFLNSKEHMKNSSQTCSNPSSSIPETIKTNPVHRVTKTVAVFVTRYMTTVKNAIATKFIKPKTNIINIKGKQLYTQMPPLFIPALKSLESDVVFI